MDNYILDCLKKNFLAGIDMLSGIITICPDKQWKEKGRIFYLGYHTTIFLDYYLSIPVKDFNPLLSYALIDPDNLPANAVDDVMPERLFERQEMTDYISAIRKKCARLFAQLHEDDLNRTWISRSDASIHGLCASSVINYSVLEILLYNLRHLQHHVGQLNLLLREKEGVAAGWIAQAE